MSPEERRAIWEMTRIPGATDSEIGQHFGRSHTLVARVRKGKEPPDPHAHEPPAALDDGLPPEPEATTEPLPELEITEADLADPLAAIGKVVRAAAATVNRAAKQGDNRSLIAASNTLAAQLNTLARLTHDMRQAEGTIVRTAEQMKAARDAMREKLAALAARGGIRCADCQRELSIQWGRGLEVGEKTT